MDSALIMTLNCIWWSGSSLGNLGSMEYLFTVITSHSTLIQNRYQIDLFENYSY